MRPRYVFVFAAALTGCELVFPTHETDGGAGGSGATTSSSSESSSRSSSGSGAGNVDAGCGETLPSDFCAREKPDGSFCSDFNEHVLIGPWDDLNQGEPDGEAPSTSAHLDSKVVHSDGGSVRFDGIETMIDGGCKIGQFSSRLRKSISKDAKAVHLDFYYRGCDGRPAGDATLLKLSVNCVPDGKSSTFGLFNWGIGSGGDVFTLYGGSDGTEIGDGSVVDAPSATEWTHVKIDVVIGSTGSADVKFGCSNVYHQEGDTSCPGDTERSLLIGMYTCTGVPDCSIYFDDLVMTVDE